MRSAILTALSLMTLLAAPALAGDDDCDPAAAPVAADLGAVVVSPSQEPEEEKKSRLTKVSAETFMALVVKNEKPAVVEFGATWCVPCHAQLAILEELAEKNEGDVFFGKIDVDEEKELMEQLGLKGVPAVLITNDGKVVKLLTGVTSGEDLQAILDGLSEPPADGEADAGGANDADDASDADK